MRFNNSFIASSVFISFRKRRNIFMRCSTSLSSKDHRGVCLNPQDQCRKYTPFASLAIRTQFHIACSFKFFKDHFIHFAAGITNAVAKNGKEPPFSFSLRQKLFWLLHCICFNTAAWHFTACWRNSIVCTGKT